MKNLMMMFVFVMSLTSVNAQAQFMRAGSGSLAAPMRIVRPMGVLTGGTQANGCAGDPPGAGWHSTKHGVTPEMCASDEQWQGSYCWKCTKPAGGDGKGVVKGKF